MARDLTELLIRAGFAEIWTSKTYSTLIKSDALMTFYMEGRRTGNPWPCIKVITLENIRDYETLKFYHLRSKDVGRAESKGKTIALDEHQKDTNSASRILFYVQSLADEAEA